MYHSYIIHGRGGFPAYSLDGRIGASSCPLPSLSSDATTTTHFWDHLGSSLGKRSRVAAGCSNESMGCSSSAARVRDAPCDNPPGFGLTPGLTLASFLMCSSIVRGIYLRSYLRTDTALVNLLSDDKSPQQQPKQQQAAAKGESEGRGTMMMRPRIQGTTLAGKKTKCSVPPSLPPTSLTRCAGEKCTLWMATRRVIINRTHRPPTGTLGVDSNPQSTDRSTWLRCTVISTLEIGRPHCVKDG